MANTIQGFTVVFDESVPEEYMDTVKKMVYSIKYVAKIEPVVQSTSQFLGEMKEKTRIANFLIEAIKSDFKHNPQQ